MRAGRYARVLPARSTRACRSGYEPPFVLSVGAVPTSLSDRCLGARASNKDGWDSQGSHGGCLANTGNAQQGMSLFHIDCELSYDIEQQTVFLLDILVPDTIDQHSSPNR